VRPCIATAGHWGEVVYPLLPAGSVGSVLVWGASVRWQCQVPAALPYGPACISDPLPWWCCMGGPLGSPTCEPAASVHLIASNCPGLVLSLKEEWDVCPMPAPRVGFPSCGFLLPGPSVPTGEILVCVLWVCGLQSLAGFQKCQAQSVPGCVPHRLAGYAPEAAASSFSAFDGVMFLTAGSACNLTVTSGCEVPGC